MRLTVRIDGDDLVASNDDDTTVRIDLTAHPNLRHALHDLYRAVSASNAAHAYDGVSATTLASLMEAARLRPRTDDPPPPHPIEFATTDERRVVLGPLVNSAPTAPLDHVLACRCSRRNIGRASLVDLAALLVRAGRTRMVSNSGWFESRPFPSAGARHPIELVVATNGVDGLDDGWWWFEPFICQLAPVTFRIDPAPALTRLADVTAMYPPPTAAVFAVASFERTLSRYPAGSTLVWRDAGAALTTVHLAATELGLASCIIGTSGTVYLTSPETSAPVVDVGAVIVGATMDAP